MASHHGLRGPHRRAGVPAASPWAEPAARLCGGRPPGVAGIAIRLAAAVLVGAATVAGDPAAAGELERDPAAGRPPSVAYTVSMERGASASGDAASDRRPGAAGWIVEVVVQGVTRSGGPVEYRLSDWGGWQEAGWDHGELVEAEPPLDVVDVAAGRFVHEPPRRSRTLRLVYRIGLTELRSEEQEAFGLLPTAGDEYAFGYSWNTLVQVLRQGVPLDGSRTIHLRPLEPAGPVVTGWAGLTRGEQSADLTPEMGNGPIAFGEPARVLRRADPSQAVEVFQFGRGPDVTAVVAEVLAAVAPAVGRHLGVPARSPYRAFVTDTTGGGMGSHFGLRIGVMEDAPADHAASPWLRSHVAHELIHDWLGLRLVQRDASLVWFEEGFTEYLALWYAAATGLVDKLWFAGRLLELEVIARGSPAHGEVAFGDAGVGWRDGDGPIEILAYTAAPVLAFRLDAELRRRHEPGLPRLVRDLLAAPDRTYALDDLRGWFAARGLHRAWRRFVERPGRPDVAETLEDVGYVRRRGGDGVEGWDVPEDASELDAFFTFEPE